MKLNDLMKEVSIEIWEKIKTCIETRERIEETPLTFHLWERVYKTLTEETIAAKRTLQKPEHITGADLEWWILDVEEQKAIAFRIQAKAISRGLQSYPMLRHMVNGKDQTDILINESINVDKMIPLYLFYNYFKNESLGDPKDVGMQFAYAQNIKKVKLSKPNHFKKIKYLKVYQQPFYRLFEETSVLDILKKFGEEVNINSSELNDFYKEYKDIPDYIDTMVKQKGYVSIFRKATYPSIQSDEEEDLEEFLNNLLQKIKKAKWIRKLEEKYRVTDKITKIVKLWKEYKAKRCLVEFPAIAPATTDFILITQVRSSKLVSKQVLRK